MREEAATAREDGRKRVWMFERLKRAIRILKAKPTEPDHDPRETAIWLAMKTGRPVTGNVNMDGFVGYHVAKPDKEARRLSGTGWNG